MFNKTILTIIVLLCVSKGELDSRNEEWSILKSVHGWSISYPKSWHADIQSYDSDPPLEEAYRIDIDGPPDCKTKNTGCAMIEISYVNNPDYARQKYSLITPVKVGTGSGYWISDTHLILEIKGEMWDFDCVIWGDPQSPVRETLIKILKSVQVH